MVFVHPFYGTAQYYVMALSICPFWFLDNSSSFATRVTKLHAHVVQVWTTIGIALGYFCFVFLFMFMLLLLDAMLANTDIWRHLLLQDTFSDAGHQYNNPSAVSDAGRQYNNHSAVSVLCKLQCVRDVLDRHFHFPSRTG